MKRPPISLACAVFAGAAALAVTARRRQANTPSGPSELALAEYKAIKAEQSARIGTRDNLLYAVIVAVGAVLAGTHSPRAWLLVPPVALILGWGYLVNDNMISLIGRFYRSHPELPGLNWETEHPADKRRRQRKTIQLLVDLVTFPGAGTGFLIGFWITGGPQPAVLLAASAVEACVMAALAWQFALYAIPRKHQ